MRTRLLENLRKRIIFVIIGIVGYCPCHGSEYDPLTGKSTRGPASVQAAPSNVLPKLDLEMDTEGFLYILPPTWGVNENGIVGYGRFL